MRLAVVQRILGLLMMIFSITMLPPMAVSVYFNDGALHAFDLTTGEEKWAFVPENLQAKLMLAAPPAYDMCDGVEHCANGADEAPLRCCECPVANQLGPIIAVARVIPDWKEYK